MAKDIFLQESCMDFKKIWRNMAEIDPPVGILTFFKQALEVIISNLVERRNIYSLSTQN